VPLRPSPGPRGCRTGDGSGCRPGSFSRRRAGARYEQLRHAALHARASAFPLGLGVLLGKGVTAWQRVLARLTLTAAAPDTPGAAFGTVSARAPGAPAPLPGPVAAELVHVLAGLAVALAGT
jgi:hypothetical protein